MTDRDFELSGIDQCPQHGVQCVFFCSKCNGVVACQECVTSSHWGHTLIDIKDVIVDKKEEIRKTLQKSEADKLFVLKTITSSSARKEETSNNIQLLIDQIKSQGENVKAKIDLSVNGLIKVCKEIENTNSSRMSEYATELDKLRLDLSNRINECQQALRLDNDVLIYKVAKNTETQLEQPKAPLLQSATFIPGQCDLSQDNVGSLCKKYESRLNVEFAYSSDVTSTEHSGSDHVWIANYKDRYISQVNEYGAITNKIQIDYDINGMSISPTTGNLWCCCYYDGITGDWNKVIEVSDLQARSRFSVQSKPLSICVTMKGDIMVGTINNITEFTSKGKKLRSFEDYCYLPRQMSVSTVTGDIAVCDRGRKITGIGQHVTVLDTDLKIKFRYDGLPKSQSSFDFFPFDAVYDASSRLLISDCNNKCIQLVSGQGQFLCIIHSDEQQPTCLTMTKNGLLCVAFQKGKMKIMELGT